MNFIRDLFGNHILISAVLGWFFAELIKIIINCIQAKSLKNFRLKDLFASGGMPSSHSAAVCALSAAIAYVYGVDSAYFAISATFSGIIMYDAGGVRKEAGEQAKALNMIMHDMFSGNPEYTNKAFKELIGHTKSQVFVGAVLGIAIGLLYTYFMGA